MKICIVEPYPNFGGGSERICFDLARGLSETDEIFLAFDQAGTMLPDYRQWCTAVRQIPLAPFGWKSLPRTLKSALTLRKQLKSWEVGGLVCSNIHMMRTLALATMRTGIRVIYHLGLPMTCPSWSKRTAFRRFHVGIAPSEPTMRTWLDAGWCKDRLCVVPNWVDAERFAPSTDRTTLRNQIGLPNDRSILLYVGRLEKEKGIQTLLESFAILVREEPRLMLVLVGESEDGGSKLWQSLAMKLGLTDHHVLFAGRTTIPEKYLAAADVAVVPSEWEEPFGLTVLEAMATCTPPVVTDVGILCSIVGDAAHLLHCQAGNAESLTRALQRVLRMPPLARHALGSQLRERVLTEYSSRSGVRAYRAKLLSD